MKKLEKYFPAEVRITRKMVKRVGTNITSNSKCLGAVALKSVLPKKYHKDVSWVFSTGWIGDVKVATKKGVDLVTLFFKYEHKQRRKDKKVTFILSNK